MINIYGILHEGISVSEIVIDTSQPDKPKFERGAGYIDYRSQDRVSLGRTRFNYELHLETVSGQRLQPVHLSLVGDRLKIKSQPKNISLSVVSNN